MIYRSVKKRKYQLERWKSHHEQFPLLSYLVRCVFAVPVASSKSERVFSIAGLLVTAFSPLHLVEHCEAYANLRYGLDPLLLQHDRAIFLRQAIVRRRLLELELRGVEARVEAGLEVGAEAEVGARI